MTQKQHVEFYRKIMLRRRLLKGSPPGPAYVPFIGDGDLAVVLYGDRDIYGVDLDANRVAAAAYKLDGNPVIQGHWPGHHHVIIQGDADVWQFGPGPHQWSGLHGFAVGDFDAYSYPYAAFRAFWQDAPKASRLTVFFTDAQKQTLFLNGVYQHPSGEKITVSEAPNSKRRIMAFYWKQTILAGFKDYVEPWKVVKTDFYLRGMMLYWGAIVENVRG